MTDFLLEKVCPGLTECGVKLIGTLLPLKISAPVKISEEVVVRPTETRGCPRTLQLSHNDPHPKETLHGVPTTRKDVSSEPSAERSTNKIVNGQKSSRRTPPWPVLLRFSLSRFLFYENFIPSPYSGRDHDSL